MKIPFFSRKPVKTAVQPRGQDGTFGQIPGKNPPDIAKTIEKEQSAITGTMNVLKDVLTFQQQLDSMVNERVESALEDYEPEGGLNVGNEWAPVISQLIPHIGPYLPGLIEKYTGVTPRNEGVQPSVPANTQGGAEANTGNPGAPTGSDMSKLIGMASKTPPNLIKPVLPTLKKELEQRGIKETDFIKAIANLAKADKVEE
jgi:hypothetical protein